MEPNKVYRWILKEPLCAKIIAAASQPLTSRQISKKTGIPQYICSYQISKLVRNNLLYCLNSSAGNSRLYFPTKICQTYRKLVCDHLNLAYTEVYLPDIDWDIYGRLCFNHRTAVIKTLDEPMQPSQIKRLLRIQRPNIKISANNIRDIIKHFLKSNVVSPVQVKKKMHLRYELTETGKQYKQLLMLAEVPLQAKQLKRY